MASFDIIIVGGGTAGCVLASRLSSINHLNILLLEAGPDNNADPNVSTPLTSHRMFYDPKYDWDFRTVPQVGLGGRVIEQHRGRMIGGSSAINSHSLVYPNRAMHDAWVAIAGDERWSWERMERFYKTFQTIQSRDMSQKGSSTAEPQPCGPIRASYPRRMHVLQSAWEDIFRSLGAYSDHDGISGRAIGGVTTTNAIDERKGERSHAGNSFLQPVLGRVNLTVETLARVTRVDFREHVFGDVKQLQAIGVTYEKEGKSVSVSARKEVILCAGVFGSPQILEISGIGSKTILEKAGVECLADLPEVGGKRPRGRLCEVKLTKIRREPPRSP
jgi:choline dehydrogenase-like flavoprotein